MIRGQPPPPGQPRAARRTTPARLGSGRGWAAHRRLLAAEPPGRCARTRLVLMRDVLAPPIDALADAQRGTRLGVGGRDSLPLLVGDLSAGAGRDLVDPVEDLIWSRPSLALRLPSLVRGTRPAAPAPRPATTAAFARGRPGLSTSAPSRLREPSSAQQSERDRRPEGRSGGTLQRRPHPALTPWGRPSLANPLRHKHRPWRPSLRPGDRGAGTHMIVQ